VPSNNNGVVFAIGKFKDSIEGGIYYYQYDPILGWAGRTYLKESMHKVKSGPNSLINIPDPNKYAFYFIGKETGSADSKVRYIENQNSVNAITAGNTHNDVVELFDYVLDASASASDVYYRRSNNYLGYYDGATSSSRDFVNTETKFDVTIYENKVFYIDNLGVLHYKEAGSATNTVYNLTPSNTFVPYSGNTTGYTDLVFDNSGNLYYIYGGQLYRRLKSNDYTTEEATIPSVYFLSGNFSINKSTGTLYCVATNRSIYQFFQFLNPANSLWEWATKKATVNSVGTTDFAGTYPVYVGDHLFYVAKTTTSAPRQDWATKSIFNLYFTSSCNPSPLRKGLDEEDVMDKETADYETGLQANVYPNPFKEELVLEMEGSGDAEVKLYNAVGKVVRTLSYNFGKTTIATDNLKEGLYTLAVYQNGKRLIAKKVVK
jgi:hypothetical protein